MGKATVKAQLDKRRILKDETYPVRLVVYFNGEKKRYGLPNQISLSEQDWKKIHLPRLKQDNLLKIKSHIDEEIGRAIGITNQLNDEFSYDSFESMLSGNNVSINSNKQKIYTIFEDYIASLREENRIGTAESYEIALKSFKSFAPGLKIKDITPKFFNQFERWMLDRKRSISTVGIYVRSFRTIINIAKDKKLLTNEMYPFGSKVKKKYEIPTGKNIKKAIDIESIKKLKEYDLITKESQFARDLWFFSLYCNGMNLADIFAIKYENIIGDFFYFIRQKTIRTQKNRTPIEIYISEPIKNIIQKWGNKDKTPGNYIFDVYKLGMTDIEIFNKRKEQIRQVNGYMKRLGKHLGIDTKITSYVARHSWATLLRNMGTSVEEIAECLGHSNISTTKSYLDSFPKEHKKETAHKLISII